MNAFPNIKQQHTERPKCGAVRPFNTEACVLEPEHKGPCDFALKRVVSTQNGCRPGCLCRKVADPNHGCSCHAETKCECVCGHDWENHEDPGGECVVTMLKDGKV